MRIVNRHIPPLLFTLLFCFASAAQAFVTTGTDANGRPRFIVDGAPFRFVGGNMNELPWFADWLIDQDLDHAKSMGLRVVRVWGVDSSMNADVMAGRLTNVLNRAQARGMFVVIALTHNYRQQNWAQGAFTGQYTLHAVPDDAYWSNFAPYETGFYNRDCGGGLWCLSDPWVSWGYTAHYKPFAERLVSLLRDHPAIFSWDIANEVSVSAKGNASLNELLTNFYVSMASAIKANDPNHLVTTGLISTGWPALNEGQRDRIYNSPNINYVTVHSYDGVGNVPNEELQDDDIYRANTRWKKPVVVEEYGAIVGTPAQPNLDATRGKIEAYYSAKLNPSDKNREVTGIMHFGVSSHSSFQDQTWYPSGLHIWLADFWRSWASQLGGDAPPPPPPPGCGQLSPGGVLLNDAQLWSCDQRFVLIMQGDGNLVLYRAGSGPLWWSGTGGRGHSNAYMQGDGNFVVYTIGGQPTWWSGTSGNPGAALFLQDDGNLVIYSTRGVPLWNSQTGGH